jgi:hypothetical protein
MADVAMTVFLDVEDHHLTFVDARRAILFGESTDNFLAADCLFFFVVFGSQFTESLIGFS